jgi:DNA-binding beta-propeller fold protein YncE
MKFKFNRKFFSALIGLACLAGSPISSADANNLKVTDSDPNPWYYLSSFNTNEVFRIDQNTGESLGVLDVQVPGPFASFVTPSGVNFFVAAGSTGEVYRFDAETGEFKDIFITAGSGGLLTPTAPILTPDEKYLFVGDLNLNGYLRYDGHTGEYIDIFADASTKPISGPFMPVFSPFPEMQGKILIASGFTNSIQIYDIESGDYEGNFVEPGSGGLVTPVGLVFGPDGNLYTTSSGTRSVKRYDGRTGAFIDDFVPVGSGGILEPRALEFGGRNSDLHVVSSGTDEVLRFDRLTGDFAGVSASGAELGFRSPRGLMFSSRPFTFAEASPSVLTPKRSNERRGNKKKFTPIDVSFFSVPNVDDSYIFELVSIEVDDPTRNVRKDVKKAKYGTDDRNFSIRNRNNSGRDRVYTITYRVRKEGEASVLATTTVTVPSS